MALPQPEFLSAAWAGSWIRRQPFAAAPVTPHLLQALAAGPGERVLDIGAGAGSITLEAAEAVGAAGSVLAVDVSPYLVDYVARMATGRGLAQVRALEADAAYAHLPGAPYDAVTSQMGVMFFAEPVPAFRNIRAHLRPGGRLVVAAWAVAAANPLHHDVLRGLDDLEVATRIAAPGPGPFSLADPDLATTILNGAGFAAIVPRRVDLTVEAAVSAVIDPRAGPHATARVATYEVRPGLVQAPVAFMIYAAVNPA